VTEETLFHQALQRPAAERAAFLDQACAGQPQLRAAVEALLRAHEEAGSLLQRPATADGPTSDLPRGRLVREEDLVAAAPAEGPGTRLGPYKLVQKLGEGGMGAVFLAEQEQPVHRRVALKVVKAGMDSAHVLARFEQERQALALMDHPNIAKVLDAGTTASGRPFFVMELVKGVPITRYCDQEQLTPAARLELFVPVCQAVQHAHQKGIIHRDLKPSNVLIALYDGRPVPKVIDFGVAKATAQKLTERTLFTEVGQVVGTLEYMAPEQAELNNLDIDTRADIYALGALLYELLTGSTPFTGRQLRSAAFTEMLRMIREVEPPKPSTRLSNSDELPSIAAKRKLEPRRLTRLVHGELDWIVMKCLEKERGRRYETANALARDLQRFLADEVVEARSPSAGYRLRKVVRRNKGRVIAVALLVLALVGGIAGTTAGLVEARRQQAMAVAGRDEKEQALRAEAAERQRADAERAVAVAINDFLLKDLLRQAEVAHQTPDRGEPLDPDVKVRTLLDRASKAVETRFPGQPLTEAAVRKTLGETYLSLGQYDAAGTHWQKALEQFAAGGAAEDRAALVLQNRLAMLHRIRRQFDQAEPLLLAALQVQTAKFGADDPDTLATQNALGLVYREEGKLEDAERALLAAVQGQTARLGADDPDTLISRHNLAGLYMAQKKYDRAEPLLLAVLAARTARLGAEHPQTLMTKHNLAGLYRLQGKLDQAEPLFREVLKSRTALLGGDHLETLTASNSLALTYLAQGKYDQAEPVFAATARGLRAKFGLGDQRTQASTQSLIECYARLGRSAEAESLCRELADHWKRTAGAASQPYALALAALGGSLLGQKKWAEAETTLRECLAIAERGAPRAWRTFDVKSLLGASLVGQARYGEAQPLLLAGYEGLKEREAMIPASSKNRLPEALERLVQLYDATGQKDNADEWRKKLGETNAAAKPPAKP
jgi:serine/threonine protein kinase